MSPSRTASEILVALSLLSSLALAACSQPSSSSGAGAGKTSNASESREKRGEQLVKLSGCNDCHTPVAFDPATGGPKPMPGRYLSGHPAGAPDPSAAPGAGDLAVIGGSFTAFRAPFGVVYAANLTPDVETGLGGWSEDDFLRTMRTGKHKGTGRAILPPMPWANLSTQSDEDLKAIFAYLRSIAPVKNAVSAPKVPAEVIEAMGKSAEALATH